MTDFWSLNYDEGQRPKRVFLYCRGWRNVVEPLKAVISERPVDMTLLKSPLATGQGYLPWKGTYVWWLIIATYRAPQIREHFHCMITYVIPIKIHNCLGALFRRVKWSHDVDFCY